VSAPAAVAAASTRAKAPGLPLALVAGAGAGFLTCGLSFYIWSAGGTALAAELGLQNWQTGMLVSWFSFGYGLFGPVMGLLAARWSPRLVLGGALVLLAACFFGFAAGETFEQLVVLRAGMGLTAAAATPVGTLLLTRGVPRARLPLGIGLGMSCFGVGALMPFGLFVPLLGAEAWRAHASLAGLFGLVGAALVLLLAGRGAEPERGGADQRSIRSEPTLRWTDVRQLFRVREVHLVGLYTWPLLIPMLSIVSWAPAFLQRGLGVSAADAGTLTGAVGVGMLIAPLVGSWLMLRFGSPRVLLLSPLVFVLLPAAMVVVSEPWQVMLLVLLSGGMPKLAFSALLTVLPRFAPVHLTGLVAGYANLAGFVIAMGPPALFGAVLDRTNSFQLAFLTLAILTLPSLLLGWLIYRRLESPRDSVAG
jgi:predicted MFS family arabinose efflux permease